MKTITILGLEQAIENVQYFDPDAVWHSILIFIVASVVFTCLAHPDWKDAGERKGIIILVSAFFISTVFFLTWVEVSTHKTGVQQKEYLMTLQEKQNSIQDVLVSQDSVTISFTDGTSIRTKDWNAQKSLLTEDEIIIDTVNKVVSY